MFYDFALEIANNVWTKQRTRQHSLTAAKLFSEYKNHAELDLREFDESHIYSFIYDLRTRTRIADSTCNRYIAAISRVFREAKKLKRIDKLLKVEYFQETGGRFRTFTTQEADELVQWFRDMQLDWMADMVILSLNSGMRASEIVGLKSDVTFIDNNRFISLPAHLSKNKKPRRIPLNDAAREAALRLVDTVKNYTPKRFDYHWQKARFDIARGDKEFTFHLCRHTFATNMANDLNANAIVLKEILGHSSIQTTMKYVKVKPEAMLELVNQL